jgi:hypothetical protein
MPASNEQQTALPVFLRWQQSPEEETHFFVRTDWVMDFLFEHLPREDAIRTWTKMHAERILADQGQQAAEEFLATFGVTEH